MRVTCRVPLARATKFEQGLRHLLLVFVLRHRCFLVLQHVDLLLEFLFLRQQVALRRIIRCALRGADSQQREVREKAPFA